MGVPENWKRRNVPRSWDGLLLSLPEGCCKAQDTNPPLHAALWQSRSEPVNAFRRAFMAATPLSISFQNGMLLTASRRQVFRRVSAYGFRIGNDYRTLAGASWGNSDGAFQGRGGLPKMMNEFRNWPLSWPLGKLLFVVSTSTW